MSMDVVMHDSSPFYTDIVGVREIELERRMPDYHPNDKWEAQFSGLDESTAYEGPSFHTFDPNEL